MKGCVISAFCRHRREIRGLRNNQGQKKLSCAKTSVQRAVIAAAHGNNKSVGHGINFQRGRPSLCGRQKPRLTLRRSCCAFHKSQAWPLGCVNWNKIFRNARARCASAADGKIFVLYEAASKSNDRKKAEESAKIGGQPLLIRDSAPAWILL